MKYKPVTAVWEITMGCNLRCKHCGSSCEGALPDELTTEEALRLCDDIGRLGLKWITLSGGEPLTRKDWHLIAARLRQNKVVPNIITNGWYITEEILDKAAESGIGTFAISLDGIRETHDFMRKEGSFDRIMAALDLAGKKNITAGIITTINKSNIRELPALREILLDKGVTVWQLQIGLPMGNFAENNHLLISPEQVDEIIDFTFESVNDPRLSIYPADCIGYYNSREVQVRSKAYRSEQPLLWQGCTAGKRSFGILHNGDILGCTSIRDRQFIEGNIRDRSLTDIWSSEDTFGWSRGITKEKLGGLCGTCKYGETCLGGCPNTRLTMNNDIHSENRYCSYNVGMRKASDKLHDIDERSLAGLGKKFAHKGELQLAELAISKALETAPHDTDLLNYHGYVNFMLGNYSAARKASEAVLNLDPHSVYANKGMGLSLSRLGHVDEGIRYLYRAVELTDEHFMDPYYDLALLLIENSRKDEACEVIERGRQMSPQFAQLGDMLHGMMSSMFTPVAV